MHRFQQINIPGEKYPECTDFFTVVTKSCFIDVNTLFIEVSFGPVSIALNACSFKTTVLTHTEFHCIFYLNARSVKEI